MEDKKERGSSHDRNGLLCCDEKLLFLLAVVIAATYLGRGPSILVSVLGVLAFDYFFIPPFLTFVVADTEYIITFIVLFGVGLVISQLTARVRDQAEVAQRRDKLLVTANIRRHAANVEQIASQGQNARKMGVSPPPSKARLSGWFNESTNSPPVFSAKPRRPPPNAAKRKLRGCMTAPIGWPTTSTRCRFSSFHASRVGP